MDKGISVIICAYNSATRLPITLQHIAEQKVEADISWEVIVVDNNSSDDTSRVADALWRQFNLQVPIHIIQESNPGLSQARKTGVLRANFSIIVFCDDDNWLAPDYLNTAFAFMDSNPEIGVMGGQSTAVIEGVEPSWFNEKKQLFAVGKQKKQSGNADNRGYLWGAGMVIRANFLKNLYRNDVHSILSDRVHQRLTSGGDSEICKWFLLCKFQLWYEDSLQFQHFIPENRLRDDYLKNLMQGFNTSKEILMAYNRALVYYRNKDSHVRYARLIKSFLKLLTIYLGFRKYRKQKNWYLQELQLTSYSIFSYNKNLKKVQRLFDRILFLTSAVNNPDFN